jgi:hypothetical protein
MGTNYYWKVNVPTGGDSLMSDDPRSHIGKSSFAGKYCVKCRLTLCRGGESKIHYGHDFYESCPKCGCTYNTLPSFIVGTSSFTWAQDPEAVRACLGLHLDEDIVVNENGEAMTGRSFRELEEACLVQFTDSVGTRFS